MVEVTGKDSLEILDIEALTLNPKFGSLIFDGAKNKLEKIRQWFIEFEKLDYQSQLPEDIVNQIHDELTKFDNFVIWLQNFDIENSSNPKQEHDNFEVEVNRFYNSFYNSFVVSHLIYLRQNAQNENEDKKKLQNELNELASVRKNYESLVKGIQEENKKLSTQKGERAAIKFGKHFESQYIENEGEAKDWLEKREIWFKWLMYIITANLILYVFLFITNKLAWWPHLAPKEFFTLEYGLVKLALLSLLSYAISFTSRNYNVNSNLVVLNKHRKNVAETLNDFLDTELEKEDRSKIVEQATASMFDHKPIGYLPKIESKDDGPLASIVNNILKPFN
jgi:hypothetical protein